MYNLNHVKEFKPNKKQENSVLLFDLDDDPYERWNLAEDEVEKVEEMKELAKQLAKVRLLAIGALFPLKPFCFCFFRVGIVFDFMIFIVIKVH